MVKSIKILNRLLNFFIHKLPIKQNLIKPTLKLDNSKINYYSKYHYK